MTTIFISHASADDKWATQLEGWLKQNGFTDIFVDHSADSGIDVSKRWMDELVKAAGRTRAVIFLVTKAWLARDWCQIEFGAPVLNHRRIPRLPLLLLGDKATLSAVHRTRLAAVEALEEYMDLAAFLTSAGDLDFARDKGKADQIRRVLVGAGALVEVGLKPESFEIDKDTKPSPFPGLTSFGDDDADAAIFYGREAEIEHALQMVRRLRDKPSAAAILGDSGFGKSSLLKAGMLPRLRRESPSWIALRAFQPGRDAMLTFADAIMRTQADYGGASGSPGELAETLRAAWRDWRAQDAPDRGGLLQALQPLAQELALLSYRPDAPILIAIDQAEELARVDGQRHADEARDALADYLAACVQDGSFWRIVMTVRTDSYQELVAHSRFQAIPFNANLFQLCKLERHRLADVIEKPAGRYGVALEFDLVKRLIEDADSQDDDALPLLAFALQRLRDDNPRADRLQQQHYQNMGGLNRLIADAADRALAGQSPAESGAAAPVAAAPQSAKRIFIPHLAALNEVGGAIRRVAKWNEFDEEAQRVLSHFVEWRLATKGGGQERTVEVAHEALFRVWPLMQMWLSEELVRLQALRDIQRETDLWLAQGKARAFLAHREERLAQARALEQHRDYWQQLTADQRGYLDACIEQTEKLREHLIGQDRRNEIQKQRLFAATASNLRDKGKADAAMRIALAGGFDPVSRELGVKDTPERLASLAAAADASRLIRQCAEHPAAIPCLAWHPRGLWIATGAQDGVVRIVDPATGRVERESQHPHGLRRPNKKWVNGVAVTSDGLVISGGFDGALQVWDVESDRLVGAPALLDDEDEIRCVATGGQWVAAGSSHGNVFVWPLQALAAGRAGRAARTIFRSRRKDKSPAVLDVRFDAVGERLAIACADGSFSIVRCPSARLLWRKPDAHTGDIQAIAFSPDGGLLATAGYDARGKIWDVRKKAQALPLGVHEEGLRAIAFDRHSARVATAGLDFGVRVWDVSDGGEMLSLQGHEGAVQCAAFDPCSDRLATAGYDRNVRIWDPIAGVAVVSFKGPRAERWLSATLSAEAGVIALAGPASGVSLFRFGDAKHTAFAAGRGARRVRFSRGGARLLVSGVDDRATVFDVQTSAAMVSLPSSGLTGRDNWFGDCSAMDEAGALLATFSPSQGVMVCNVETGAVATWAPAGTSPVADLAVSADGIWLATIDAEGSVRLYRAGALEHEWATGYDQSRCIRFTPAGRIVVAGAVQATPTSMKNEVRQFDFNGEACGVFHGHGDFVWDVAFTAGGEVMASACRDRKLRFFDVETQRLIGQRTLEQWIRAAAFLPDGSAILAAGDHGMIRVQDCLFAAGLRGADLEAAVAQHRLNGASRLTRDEVVGLSSFAIAPEDGWPDLAQASAGGGDVETRIERWHASRRNAAQIETDAILRKMDPKRRETEGPSWPD